MTDKIINVTEAIQINNSQAGNLEYIAAIEDIYKVKEGGTTEVSSVTLIQNFGQSMFKQYYNDHMAEIPLSQKHEAFYLEFTVDEHATNELIQHNNDNQVNHLVQAVTFLSPTPVFVKFTSEDIDMTVEVKPGAFLIYPPYFCYRFKVVQQSAHFLQYLSVGFAFKSEE